MQGGGKKRRPKKRSCDVQEGKYNTWAIGVGGNEKRQVFREAGSKKAGKRGKKRK